MRKRKTAERWSWEPWRKKYRFELDESYKFEKDKALKEENKRYYERIPTRCGGFIGLVSDDGPEPILNFWTPKSSPTVMSIYREYKNEGVQFIKYDGYEAELIFPARLLKKILPLAKARTRRQLTPEQIEKATLRFKKYRQKSSDKKPENFKKGGENGQEGLPPRGAQKTLFGGK